MTETQVVTSNDTINLTTSAKRTAIPFGVTVLVAYLIDRFHWQFTDVQLTAISGGIGYAYWFIVRIAEHISNNPKWGWLLGSPKSPVYPTGTQTKIAP